MLLKANSPAMRLAFSNFPKASFSFRRLALGLCLIFCLLPSTSVDADDIFLISEDQLFRLGVEQSSSTAIGPIDIEPLTMEFTEEGDLLALLEDGSLYRIDPETAATEKIVEARAQAGERYLEMAAAPGGLLYSIKQGSELRRLLTLFDLKSGIELDLGVLHPGETESIFPENFNELRTLATLDGHLIGLDEEISGSRLASVGTASAAYHLLSSTRLPLSVPFQTDVDSAGNLWVAWARGTLAPPALVLFAVDSETLETANRPSYVFGVRDPIGFAIRRTDPATCQSDETSICLLHDRYRVTTTWRDFDGHTGVGSIVPGASETTTLFSFFTPDNQELMVKVLDGCGFNNRVWVFLSGTTNVEYTLRVVDTVSGEERSYSNPLGEVSTTVLDTDAFDHCPAR